MQQDQPSKCTPGVPTTAAPKPLHLSFESPLVAAQYKRMVHIIASTCVPLASEEEATVFALLGCIDAMRFTEPGDEFLERAEIISLLISPRLRLGLRQFYAGLLPAQQNTKARDFRARLSELCGEIL
jgi:hypothetical protein